MGCEQRATNEAGWPGQNGVVSDGRQPAANVVQRAEQSRAATEQGISGGDPSRRDEHEPVHTARVLRSQLGRDQAAERVADQIHVLELRRIEPTAEPTGQLAGGEMPPEPRQVEHVNTALLGQRLEHRLPPAPGA